MRKGRPAGLSRRTLIRRSIAAATTLWVLEVTAGTLGFLWPNLSRGFGGQIEREGFDAGVRLVECAEQLTRVDDAMYIDTTGVPIEEVVASVLAVVRTRL